MTSDKEIAEDLVGNLKHCKTNEEFDKCLCNLLKMVKQATRRETAKEIFEDIIDMDYKNRLQLIEKYFDGKIKEVQKK
jgi:hypothetical protein